ncbi:NAD(P)H-binding protein [Solwaraspora sp. WMMA2080]|uniref:NAD(P)H-binding protein n=1 Tax=unclassified Solwaraspora TaxID=2627926 RepID=UPI00248C805B|nr:MULTISPECIES: NAD(P)H-binding protein [unclassified Solwaraspora]WBB97231.1 NAD(P)H-binding protein [Solwaraspora sp. WMMA2059]WBC18868.1 NAD(P)H-binding protein [Solwaraspora sp. WMMA2080]
MITVTGAAGQLGRLVVDELLDSGLPPAQLVAVVRNPDKADDLAARGVQVRHGDYDQPQTLGPALAGTRKLLLISGSEVGRRIDQHRNAVAAAKAAGVDLIAYTSILKADTSSVPLAAEHLATEQLIRDSGLPFVLLRNGWYLENYTGSVLPQALATGSVLGAAGSGRVAAATRADFAAAAVAVLTAPAPAGAAANAGTAGTVYELGGDEPFTLAELAAEISRHSGREIGYQDLPADVYAKALTDAGVPEAFASVLAASDVGIARGDLTTDSGDLARLIGRPTTSLGEAVRAALAGLPG